MKFQVKKVENCFSDAQTYEYLLEITGEDFLKNLEGWPLRFNRKLRRPVGIAEKDGVTVKTVLAGHSVRVSYPDGSWQAEKTKFEVFLENLA